MADIPHADQPFVRREEGQAGGQPRYIIESAWFRFLDLINVTKTGVVIPVDHGGTGTTSATGTGSVVLANIPTLINPFIKGEMAFKPTIPYGQPPLFGFDSATTSVTAAATTIVSADVPMLVVIHDKTSGGMAVDTMDSTAGVNFPAAFNSIAGIAFTRAAGVGLQAAVTAGANPRILSPFSISTGFN